MAIANNINANLPILFISSLPFLIWIKEITYDINKIINILEPIFLVILLLLVTAYLIDSSYNPFLYFRF